MAVQEGPDIYKVKSSSCCHHQNHEAQGKLANEHTGLRGIYTCPMHPEIQQEQAGNCPICGMALEATLPNEQNSELIDIKRRFWLGFILTLPIFILEMSAHLLGLHYFDTSTTNYLQLILSTPVVLWAGQPFIQQGWLSVKSGKLNMFTLISMGIGVAWLYSIVATLLPKLFPISLQNAVYFEAACVITVLVLLGQILELNAREQTNDAIRALLELAPKTARRITQDNQEEDVPLKDVLIGDLLRVRPGEKIPLDGSVKEGSGAVDESMITGESMPVKKELHDTVIGGTINQSGAFIIEVNRVGKDTVLSQIIHMVSQAQRSRAPIQRLSDRVSSCFVPAVILSSFLSFILWFIYGPEPTFSYALISAISVLIIACPCALGLATPMSIMVGIGKAAQANVLIKNAQALQLMEKINTLVLDKTGTLTKGKPTVTKIITSKGFTEGELLRLVASVEQGSEHPLAHAVLMAAKNKNLELFIAKDFNAASGKGVVGKVNGKIVAIGNAVLMKEYSVEISPLNTKADELRSEGVSIVFVAVDHALAGLLAIADPIKESTEKAIELLSHQGLRIVMLTGDNLHTAQAVAKKIHIEEIEAQVLPEDKSKIIEKLRSQGNVVAMAGDGINDAPALAAADVGIAMGAGTDVAIESAGITLLKNDLMDIVHAHKLSKQTMRNIRQNLFFAFIYNIAGVAIAAGILYPVFGILLSPMIAAAAMSLSSFSVITNALRLKFMKI